MKRPYRAGGLYNVGEPRQCPCTMCAMRRHEVEIAELRARLPMFSLWRTVLELLVLA